MQQRLPVLICFVAGILMFLQYFSRHPVARTVFVSINDYWQIIFAFTLLVGVAAFGKSNLRQIGRGIDTPYRFIALSGLVIMPVLAIIGGIKIDSPFQWAFEYMLAPMQATVFSLLAFFVASASYRGFRARNLQAAVLLGAALIVLIGRVPISEMISDSFPKVTFWIQNYPSMSARRGILIGIGLGSMTTALRVILGIERTYLRGE
ncbi:MAG: hypothetical protein JSV44_10980 [Candidatus Zixiibacteriota bacterium]|nr:MAG: hypothetical protein JSV44_10980 [candidate division Zixibacteria bacterium]